MPDNLNKPTPPQMPPWFFYGTLGIFLMLLSAFAVVAIHSSNHRAGLPVDSISRLSNGPIRIDTQTSRFILRKGIPALDRSAGEDDPFTLFNFNWSEIYWKLAANIKNATPQEILKAQFPLLALVKPRPLPRPIKIVRQIPPPDVPEIPGHTPTPLTGAPTVFLYHTHTTESYIPVSGKDHKTNEEGDIVQVGTYLQQALEEKYGVKCVHSKDIHDTYPFRDSYKRSQATVIKYINEYPSFKAVLDIHRNATPGVDASCSIRGQETATIAIVVGSDKMGLPHPNWKKNLEFASKLTDTMNLYYPGLCSGIVVSDARYNQHLNDHALIIEFGDQNSNMEKIYRSVDLFAEVLVLVMNQESQRSNTTTN